MRKHMLVAGVLLTGFVAAPAHAQGTVAGNWITEFDTGIRNENGVETSLGKRQARITLTVTGDSVIGTWQALADSSGASGARIQLRGKVTDGKVELTTEPVERVVRMNDDEQRVKMVETYNFTVHGETLEGTRQVGAVDGSFGGISRPFSAKREKM